MESNILNKPLMGLDKYPEFKKVVNDIVKQTIRTIDNSANIVESEMRYKKQFVLEMVIQQLENFV